jgi:hypothetical protein
MQTSVEFSLESGRGVSGERKRRRGAARSSFQAGLELGEGEAVEAEDFLAGEVAAEDGDGAARETELVGEKFAEGGRGAALDGRGMDLDFQGVADQPITSLRGALGRALMARVQEEVAAGEGLTTDYLDGTEDETSPTGALGLP